MPDQKAPAARQTSVRRSDYWTSVVILVFVAAFFISVAAVCYGIITTPPAAPGVIRQIAFPWISWLAAILTASAVILGFAQYIANKRAPEEAANAAEAAHEQAWASALPGKALGVYRIVRDAPLFVVCAALVILGATLLVIDGAFALVSGIILALVPYAPYFIGGITLFAVAIAAIMAWFRHASNRLAAEYAFRREVMERTGVILLDTTGKAVLPPGTDRGSYAIGQIQDITAEPGPLPQASPVKALPPGSRPD